jgi:uncharacterized SAM-binding protein YcdF (DUF218 family)
MVIAFIIWLMGAVFFTAHITRLNPAPSHIPSDGAVVFTGEKGRITATLEFCQEHDCKLIHISGIYPEFHHSKEPSSLSRLHISDDKATNTQENIIQTKKWIDRHKIKSVRLFTSDYHMPRCLLEAQKWNITIFPHPLHLKVDNISRVRFIFYEYNKYLVTLALSIVRRFKLR